MKPRKRKALLFTQIILALNFMLFGYLFYDETEYRNVTVLVSFIGALACIYDAIRIYRNNNTKP